MFARLRGRDIEIKTPGELEAMRAAGALVARTLAAVTAVPGPGGEHRELDEVAEGVIRAAAPVPSFLGYHGFPASICASVNEQIVHGHPVVVQVLADGDLVSVDCGRHPGRLARRRP
jgi:methionyl aminopeptidase